MARDFKGLPDDYDGWDTIDLFSHYFGQSGNTLTLEQMGLQNEIQRLVKQPNWLGKKDGRSLHSDFLDQILQGESRFRNGYRLLSEREISQWNNPLWSIGGVVISGEFKGNVINQANRYFLVGKVDYSLSDEFTYPLDVGNFGWRLLQVNPFGEPFQIKGYWTEPVNIDITEQQYHNLYGLWNTSP